MGMWHGMGTRHSTGMWGGMGMWGGTGMWGGMGMWHGMGTWHGTGMWGGMGTWHGVAQRAEQGTRCRDTWDALGQGSAARHPMAMGQMCWNHRVQHGPDRDALKLWGQQ